MDSRKETPLKGKESWEACLLLPPTGVEYVFPTRSFPFLEKNQPGSILLLINNQKARDAKMRENHTNRSQNSHEEDFKIFTESPDLMVKRFAIMVLNPGARQDCAMKPSLSSARQMTSSPCFQSQLGMLSR